VDFASNVPHVCEDVTELCAHCGITVPDVHPPKVTWIRVLDSVSQINKAYSHPWVFFNQDAYDAAGSSFSRTTRPNPHATPPRRIGTPSHSSGTCGGRCRLITDAAWVDFKKCKPVPEFRKSMVGKTSREQIRVLSSHPKSRVCHGESKNIEAQLWVALLAFRGVYGQNR
jgi:hypothetical protein